MTAPLSWRRRLLYTVLAVLAALTAVELVLRVLGIGSVPPGITVTRDDAQVRVEVAAPASSLKVDRTFAARKAAGAYRVVFLGASTTAGVPFAPACSFPDIVAKRLEVMFPKRVIEAVNLGVPTRAVRNTRDVAEVVEDADLVVVEAGHNEFLANNLPDAPDAMVGLARAFDRLRLARLVRAFAGESATAARTSFPPRDAYELVGDDASSRASAVVARFREDLAAIVRRFRARDVPVVVILPPSNWVDYWPEPSAVSDPVDRASIQASVTELAALVDDLPAGADALCTGCDALIAAAPNLAIAHHWRGLALHHQGDAEGASAAIERAYQCAPKPVSAAPPIHRAIRDACEREGGWLADANARFLGQTDGWAALPWLVDHCHPSLEGQYLLASTVLDAMEEHGALSDAWPRDRDPDLEYALELLEVPRLYRFTGRARAGMADLRFALVSSTPEVYARRAVARLAEDPAHAAPDPASAACARGVAWLLADRPDAAAAELSRVPWTASPSASQLWWTLVDNSPRVARRVEEALPALRGALPSR